MIGFKLQGLKLLPLVAGNKSYYLVNFPVFSLSVVSSCNARQVREKLSHNLKMTATAVYGRAESVQWPVCFVNVQSSLHENVVFSVLETFPV